MSSTVHAPKISTVRILNDRNLMSLFVLAALMVTLVVSFTYTADRPAAESINYEAYMTHRQGEWLSVPSAVNIAEAYRIFRRGEVSSPVSNAEAYILHRQGEWTSVDIPAVDLTAYHLSERTLVDPNAGLTMYLNSERTSTPVRFTQYQLSEWMAK